MSSSTSPPTVNAGRRRRAGAIAFVAIVLGMQVIAGFRLLNPPRSFGLDAWRIAPDPTFWPFLAYDMYTQAFEPGRSIDRARLFAVDAHGDRTELTHCGLGLTFRQFRERYVNPLRDGHESAAAELVELARAHAIDPREIHVEIHPLVVTREGVVDGPIRRVRIVRVGPAEVGS